MSGASGGETDGLRVPEPGVYRADALDFLRSLPAQSVDCVLTDPPYFRVKDDAWDRAWESDAAFLAWMGALADEWARVLKTNGSLWVFASQRMSARVECLIGERMEVLNRITWAKQQGRGNGTSKESLRAFFPQSESIIFAGQDTAPIRAYLIAEIERAGWTVGRIIDAWQSEHGTKSKIAGHWFWESQWKLPTEKSYAWLRSLLAGEFLRREYADLRRPFFVSADVPWSDVWMFDTVPARDGKHICEKPQAMLRHMIAASTRPGALVLDSFAGSGSTGAACKALGRRFIASEKSAHWAEVARLRWERDDPEQQPLF